MPVTDCYVIQYLLESTTAAVEALQWSEQGGCFRSRLGEVHVQLQIGHTAQGSRWILQFHQGVDEINLCEPERPSFFSRDRDPEERRLADLLNRLIGAVKRQCTARKMRSAESEEAVRQRIYRSLLFAGPAEGK